MEADSVCHLSLPAGIQLCGQGELKLEAPAAELQELAYALEGKSPEPSEVARPIVSVQDVVCKAEICSFKLFVQRKRYT